MRKHRRPPGYPRKSMLVLLAGAVCVAAQAPTAPQIAERLTPNALKADVSFLASDALEGRGTPSRGLDVAAEYIAAQFRRAGLEPAGDDGYFQTARLEQVAPNLNGFDLAYESPGRTVHAQSGAVSLQEPAAVDLEHAAIAKVEMNPAALGALKPEQVEGKVLVVGAPSAGMYFWSPPAELRPALLIFLRERGRGGAPGPRLRPVSRASVPTLMVWDHDFRTVLAAAKPGPVEGTITAHIAAPAVTPVTLRNVIGVLRGADPLLKDTYLLVTAHYDHLGIRASGDGDRIFNGANDDASGTASAIEIAEALAALPQRPRRSIAFVTFFGEELGEVGSGYYMAHPVFPLAKTIADVNLEQLGRTDDTEGPRVGAFNLTGFDFTNMSAVFQKEGAAAGIRVVKDEKNSDAYFSASDNAPFAAAGIPSTTISVAYAFRDYHAVGDEWQKLDYENLARVDRAITLAVYALADSTEEPQWKDIPQTQSFVKARAKLAH